MFKVENRSDLDQKGVGGVVGDARRFQRACRTFFFRTACFNAAHSAVLPRRKLPLRFDGTPLCPYRPYPFI